MQKYFLGFLLFAISFSSIGQKKKSSPGVTSNIDSALYSKLEYRLIGPFRGGRSAAVAGSYKDKNVFYMGATGGGIWKTIDAGANWKNISDKYFGGTMGSVAVAPSDDLGSQKRIIHFPLHTNAWGYVVKRKSGSSIESGTSMNLRLLPMDYQAIPR